MPDPAPTTTTTTDTSKTVATPVTSPGVAAASSSTALSPTNPKVTTTAPTSSVAVTVPNTSGTVTFSLVVTDNLGVASAPATITVNIQSSPVAVLKADSTTVPAGGAIKLSGTGSTSSGSIASYTFSLVTPS